MPDRMSERMSERMPLSLVTVCSRPDSDNTDGGPWAAWLEAAAVCSQIWPPYTTHPGQCPWCHLKVQLYLKWSSAPFQALWGFTSHCVPVFSQSFKIANAGFFIKSSHSDRCGTPCKYSAWNLPAIIKTPPLHHSFSWIFGFDAMVGITRSKVFFLMVVCLC